MILLEGERLEDIGSGLKIIQNKEYYRFSEDSVLLVHFIGFHPGDSILDLGTGSGIIPLLLIQRENNLKITGIEIQKELAYMAQRSIEYNNFEKSISIIQGDLRDSARLFGNKKWDRVVTNPPYFRVNEGRVSPKENIAIARHEIKCTLEEIIETASSLLKAQGSFYIVHRYDRLLEILLLCRKNGLFPTREQPISAQVKKSPHLILVECRKT
ncbi:MAG: hypothetical protein APF76_14625 [Desulfitibacter sp. BRH_c19]|nr:MAG: hypothetical protein APF76_14625 [Desulfitibacter sp. BRH_c19]